MDIRDSKLASEMLGILHGLARARDWNYEEDGAARHAFEALANKADALIERAAEMGLQPS